MTMVEKFIIGIIALFCVLLIASCFVGLDGFTKGLESFTR